MLRSASVRAQDGRTDLIGWRDGGGEMVRADVPVEQMSRQEAR